MSYPPLVWITRWRNCCFFGERARSPLRGRWRTSTSLHWRCLTWVGLANDPRAVRDDDGCCGNRCHCHPRGGTEAAFADADCEVRGAEEEVRRCPIGCEFRVEVCEEDAAEGPEGCDG